MVGEFAQSALALSLSSAFASAPSFRPKWRLTVVCQIHGSLICVDPGSFGLRITVLALTSSGFKTLSHERIECSAFKETRQDQHCEYIWQCWAICWFNFFIMALDLVVTAFCGATWMTWEYWKLFQQWGPIICWGGYQHLILNEPAQVLNSDRQYFHLMAVELFDPR